MRVQPGAPPAGGEPAHVLSPPTGQAQARVEAWRDGEQVLSPRGQCLGTLPFVFRLRLDTRMSSPMPSRSWCTEQSCCGHAKCPAGLSDGLKQRRLCVHVAEQTCV